MATPITGRTKSRQASFGTPSKAFRHGESEFYDTYRRLLDRPETFGADETEQVKQYLEDVELIRRYVRNAETDSLPMIEDVKEQVHRTKGNDAPGTSSADG